MTPAAPRRLIDLSSLLGPRLRLTGTRTIARPRRSPTEFAFFVAEEELAQATLARVGGVPPTVVKSHRCREAFEVGRTPVAACLLRHLPLLADAVPSRG